MRILSVIALSALALSATAQSYHITGKSHTYLREKRVVRTHQLSEPCKHLDLDATRCCGSKYQEAC